MHRRYASTPAGLKSENLGPLGRRIERVLEAILKTALLHHPGCGAAQKTLPDLRMDTARQNKKNNRRNREGRFLDGTSLAVSQAGVNDIIAPKYSHHRRLLARGSRHSSIALFGSCGRKNPGRVQTRKNISGYKNKWKSIL